MARKKATLTMDLIMTKVQKKLKTLDKAWKMQKRSILSVKNAIAVVFMGAAVKKVLGVGASLIANAREQEQAEQRLVGALIARGKHTADNVAIMKEFAGEIQRLTTFGDEAVLSQSAFLTSLGMTEEKIKAVIRVAADLAAGTGKTLEFGVLNIAKTFGGLTGELGELIPQIKKLTVEQLKAGKAAEMVGAMFKGQAEALAATPTGKLTQLAGFWKDIKQSVGGGVADAMLQVSKNIGLSADELARFNDELGELMSIKVSSAIQDLFEGFRAIANARHAFAASAAGAAGAAPFGLGGAFKIGLDSDAAQRYHAAKYQQGIERGRGRIADIDAREAMAREEIESRRRADRRRREQKNKASIGTVR